MPKEVSVVKITLAVSRFGGLALMFAVAASAGAQTLTTIDVPDASAAVALDINDAGVIVGRYLSSIDGQTHGFLRTSRGDLRSIDVPGAIFTVAAGINNDGYIVGQFRLATDSPRVRRGFLLSEGGFKEIDPPGALFTNVLGIGEGGAIVGRYCTTVASPCTPNSRTVHGFLLVDGVYTTIDVPGALGTNAWSISPGGTILGGYTGADGSTNLFLLTSDGFSDVTGPPGTSVELDKGGLNPEGDVVAAYCDTTCVATGADFHGLLIGGHRSVTVDVPGARSTILFGTNARRDLVGLYIDGSGATHGFLIAGRESIPNNAAR
jgi:uncharacterized protein DUF3466